MADVFISKSSNNDAFAYAVCRVLEQHGCSCWIAPRNLTTQVGSNYAKELFGAVKNSKVLLLILSRDSNKSEHVLNEVSSACDNKVTVFTYQIEQVEPRDEFQYYLSQKQWLIWGSDKDNGDFQELVTRITNILKIKDNLNAGYRDEEYDKKLNYEMLKKELSQKRSSTIRSIEKGNDYEYDKYHVYEKITRIDLIDSVEDTWRSYRFLDIKNVSDENTMFIVHKETGESKCTFKKMKVQARQDGPLGERLQVESMVEIQPNFDQVFKIHFNQPLEPGQTTRIFYKIEWPDEPGSYYKGELRQSISLTRYLKGVHQLSFSVYEPYEITRTFAQCITKTNTTITRSEKAQSMSIADEPLFKDTPLAQRELAGIKYDVDNVDFDCYIIRYDIKVDEDDEDDDSLF